MSAARPGSWTDELRDQLAELWCLHGLTHEEIAAIINKTPKAVECQIGVLGLRLTLQGIQARRAAWH